MAFEHRLRCSGVSVTGGQGLCRIHVNRIDVKPIITLAALSEALPTSSEVLASPQQPPS